MKLQVVPQTARAPAGTSRQTPTPDERARLAFLHPHLKSKKHAKLVLRVNGFTSNAEGVDEFLGSLEKMLDARRRRSLRRMPVTRNGAQSTLQVRLDKIRRLDATAAAKQCLRHGATGGHSMSVELTTDAAAVDYYVQMSGNRDTYRGSFKGWVANEDHHMICVPVDWRARVLRRGLAVLGGMLTLNAQQLVSHGDVELFQASWAAQGRGYQVNVHHGVIARYKNETFHAEVAQSAIDGVLRKAKRSHNNAPRTRKCSYELTTEDFVKRYRRFGTLNVRASDAYEVGACVFGVRAWCERVGINLDEETVPLSRLLDGFAQSPLIEARKTILHVVAEHRAWLRSVAKRAAA